MRGKVGHFPKYVKEGWVSAARRGNGFRGIGIALITPHYLEGAMHS